MEMKRGPATKKMMQLVGYNRVEDAMKAYKTYTVYSRNNGSETILDALAKVQKGLHALRTRGYLANEGELAVYDCLIEKLGVHEKLGLLLDLIYKTYWYSKTGPLLQPALNWVIFLLKKGYDDIGSQKPFWPVLAGFIEEQEIDQTRDTSPEELKTRYNRYAKQYAKLFRLLSGYSKFPDPGTDPDDDFIFFHNTIELVYEVGLLPKDERLKEIKETELFTSAILREYLDKNAKK